MQPVGCLVQRLARCRRRRLVGCQGALHLEIGRIEPFNPLPCLPRDGLDGSLLKLQRPLLLSLGDRPTRIDQTRLACQLHLRVNQEIASRGDVLTGLETAQRGLGAVDMGLDAATQIYTQGVDLCERNAALPGCDRLGNPEEVLRKAEALGSAYDDTAAGLDAMQRAYNDVAPHFEAAAEVVKGAGMFSR